MELYFILCVFVFIFFFYCRDVKEGTSGSGSRGVVSVVDVWTPGPYTALKALLSARLCAAIWGLINDCDETYNYWEPVRHTANFFNLLYEMKTAW